MSALTNGLLGERRVVVCLGPGGVGKTSVVAALALAAAGQGKRVLAITIDPARRLAQALGLHENDHQLRRVDLSRFGGAKAREGAGPGSLEVRVLDAGAALSELVSRRTQDPAARDALLRNRAFGLLVRNMAGVQPYMAMETVLELERDQEHDLILVDTPPSERALEFLDAPRRMQRLLESPVTRALSSIGKATARVGDSALGRGARLFFKGVSQVTGKGLVDELSALLGAMGDLLGGFFDRAVLAEARFRSPEYGVLLVTAAGAIEAQEAERMLGLIVERDLNLDGVVLNRVVSPPPAYVTSQDFTRALDQALAPAHALASDPERLAGWLAEVRAEAEVHAAAQTRLQRWLAGRVPVHALPRISGELKTAQDLVQLREALSSLTVHRGA